MLTTEWNIEEEIAYVRQEAWEEGWGKRNFEIAQSALAEGATIEFVQKITGLDTRTIARLS